MELAAGTGIAEKVTSVFVRCYYRTGVEESKEYSAGGESDTIYIFDSDAATIGQATIASTIIVNRDRFESLCQAAQDVVFLHERSHLSRGRKWLITALASGTAGIGGLYLWVLNLFTSNPSTYLSTLMDSPIFAMLCVLLIILHVAIVRIDETFADLHALRGVGEETYLHAHEEFAAQRDLSLSGRIYLFLYYPDPQTVARINRWLSDGRE